MAALRLLFLVAIGLAARTDAADWRDLPVVRPVMSCEQLARLRPVGNDLAEVSIATATTIRTAQGGFCKVTGAIGPATIRFEVYLPTERWTQRYAQAAQNVLTIPRAGGNGPALHGELALAINDKGGPGISRDTPWTAANQQKRIDWAYRANHMTSLAARHLIRAFYGQPQRYAYFIGCSMGGREALAQAQRFPADFDGVIAGAPVVTDSVHNAFFPGWEWQANRRADGSVVLLSDRLAILHDAALRNCAAKSGTIDGMLQHPGACRFDPAWVSCRPGVTDPAHCLTAEESQVAEKLYTGPTDERGRLLDAGGWPLGSELSWKLSTAAGPANEAAAPGRALMRLLSPSDPAVTPATMERDFAYSAAWFDRTTRMAPLWNTANTNLEPFRQRGGKLILWIGASDQVVQPASTIAYRDGVRRQMGAAGTDAFLRFFLLPGVNHCGGGEGPDQVDLLSALMAWTELGRAPDRLVVGRTDRREGDQAQPFSQPNAPAHYTRPIFPYPLVARYAGTGDPQDAASYRAAPPPGNPSLPLAPEMARFIGPDNQRFYTVRDGALAVLPE